MSEEFLDIYDGQGRATGQVKSRKEVHRDGDWHKTFHCWIIFRGEDGTDYVVLQQRAPTASWPNKLDVAAAGHYLAGETIKDGLRELSEELGITASYDDLVSLGTRVCVEEFQAGKINHEFQEVFFLIHDLPLNEYGLDPDEVSALVAVPVEEGLELFARHDTKLIVSGQQATKHDGVTTLSPFTREVTVDDFIPMLDNYNYKMFVLAKRALAGEKHLLI